ncbi:MAG: hypothetical protein ACRD2H_13915 [Terriglobales bacterium]
MLIAMMAAWLVLVAYADARNAKGLDAKQRRAALAGAIIATLIVGFVGEVSPEIGIGFASILLVSMLLAGPSNGLLVLTKTIPANLLKGASS